MGYCAKSDLSERYGDQELKELTDETSGVAISDPEVTSACDEASSTIDLYLGVRYTVPLASPPSVVKKWACDLARLNLWGNRAGEGSAIRLEAEQALAFLKDISTGKAILPGQAAGVEAPLSAIAVTERTQSFPDTLFTNSMVTNP